MQFIVKKQCDLIYLKQELGLYYHTDTGCYYYYSDEKQTFVFHSYPDKSAENKSLIAHEKKKARKQKKVHLSTFLSPFIETCYFIKFCIY